MGRKRAIAACVWWYVTHIEGEGGYYYKHTFLPFWRVSFHAYRVWPCLPGVSIFISPLHCLFCHMHCCLLGGQDWHAFLNGTSLWALEEGWLENEGVAEKKRRNSYTLAWLHCTTLPFFTPHTFISHTSERHGIASHTHWQYVPNREMRGTWLMCGSMSACMPCLSLLGLCVHFDLLLLSCFFYLLTYVRILPHYHACLGLSLWKTPTSPYQTWQAKSICNGMAWHGGDRRQAPKLYSYHHSTVSHPLPHCPLPGHVHHLFILKMTWICNQGWLPATPLPKICQYMPACLRQKAGECVSFYLFTCTHIPYRPFQ